MKAYYSRTIAISMIFRQFKWHTIPFLHPLFPDTPSYPFWLFAEDFPVELSLIRARGQGRSEER